MLRVSKRPMLFVFTLVLLVVSLAFSVSFFSCLKVADAELRVIVETGREAATDLKIWIPSIWEFDFSKALTTSNEVTFREQYYPPSGRDALTIMIPQICAFQNYSIIISNITLTRNLNSIVYFPTAVYALFPDSPSFLRGELNITTDWTRIKSITCRVLIFAETIFGMKFILLQNTFFKSYEQAQNPAEKWYGRCYTEYWLGIVLAFSSLGLFGLLLGQANYEHIKKISKRFPFLAFILISLSSLVYVFFGCSSEKWVLDNFLHTGAGFLSEFLASFLFHESQTHIFGNLMGPYVSLIEAGVLLESWLMLSRTDILLIFIFADVLNHIMGLVPAIIGKLLNIKIGWVSGIGASVSIAGLYATLACYMIRNKADFFKRLAEKSKKRLVIHIICIFLVGWSIVYFFYGWFYDLFYVVRFPEYYPDFWFEVNEVALHLAGFFAGCIVYFRKEWIKTQLRGIISYVKQFAKSHVTMFSCY